MDWQDEGFVLERRAHGETAAIVTLLTESHGRHAGLVHGGQGQSKTSLLQVGNRLKVTWRARLTEHLGTYDTEMVSSRIGYIIQDPGRLAALQSAAALVQLALPEREPHPALFHAFEALQEALAGDAWAPAYVFWEFHFLQALGFSIDLSRCAVTGSEEDLSFVSPRSGRAVSSGGAGDYRDKLLKLPPFLIGGGYGARDRLLEICRGMAH